MKNNIPLADFSEHQLLYEGVVGAEDQGMRLDAFLASRDDLKGYSRSRIQEWIRSGLAWVEADSVCKPNTKLLPGRRITLYGHSKQTRAKAEKGPLDIIHRDEHLIVLDKQAGVTVHPAPGVENGTLVNFLLHHYPELEGMDAWRPGIVHRLDKNTSGLMVVALTEEAKQRLQRGFAERDVTKVYLALVHGVAPEQGEIDAPIGRHPNIKTRMAVTPKGGRKALSRYKRLWTDPQRKLSLLAVKILTGRTHQIRVHLDHVGHPIVGDTVYGQAMQKKWAKRYPLVARVSNRQMLHATYLQFVHPKSGRNMPFSSLPPKDFLRLPVLMRPSCQRVVVVGMPGSGKSYLSSRLAELGVPVFSADRTVAQLYEPGEDCWSLLRGRFGNRFVSGPDAPVDKGALFQAMVAEPGLRREVMTMVHPLVEHRLREFWTEHFEARFAVAEVPLFLEGGWREQNLADVVVCVDMPANIRNDLLHSRRGVSNDMAAILDSWQWSREDKMTGSDIVLNNPGEPEPLHQEMKRMLAVLRRMRVEGAARLVGNVRQLCADPGLPFTTVQL